MEVHHRFLSSEGALSVMEFKTKTMVRRAKMAPAAVGVVATLALAGAFNYYRTVDKRNRSYQDPQMTYALRIDAERLRGVAAIVPVESVIAYFSDLSVRNGGAWATNGEFVFTAVRYTLAPRFVVPYEKAQNADWVLGDFSKPVDLNQIESENHVQLVKDFGSGVVLFRRE